LLFNLFPVITAFPLAILKKIPKEDKLEQIPTLVLSLSWGALVIGISWWIGFMVMAKYFRSSYVFIVDKISEYEKYAFDEKDPLGPGRWV
jgi:hypothetical protein